MNDNKSIHDSASPVNDPIPQDVIDALAAVRESGAFNMFARNDVIEFTNTLGFYDAHDWLIDNKSRYMEALNIMGGQVSHE